MIPVLRIRNIADQSCRENQNTNLILTFFPKNLSGYELIGKKCRAGEVTHIMRRKDVICMAYNAGKNTETHS